jgi:hypothetical protein
MAHVNQGADILPVKFDHVFQFKVTLKGSKPPIWRRIVVPCDYTFWDLHVAIQDAMGWEDRHLHEFLISLPYLRHKCVIGFPESDEPSEAYEQSLILPTWLIPIAQFFTLTNRRAVYIYDFGDNWEHQVVMEKILVRDKNVQYPLCTGGRRACPPEDCGGLDEYAAMLEILADPSHPDHAEILAWIGLEFTPDHFARHEVHFADPEQRLADNFAFESEAGEDADLLTGPDATGPYVVEFGKEDAEVEMPEWNETGQGLGWESAVQNLAPPVREMQEMARRGFRGYPIATVVVYGPDDTRATKIAVGIILDERGDADILERWLVKEGDVRENGVVTNQVLAFIRNQGVRSVVLADRIMGCPHEEGIDYPAGQQCPECPFWSRHDRWTGETIQ